MYTDYLPLLYQGIREIEELAKAIDPMYDTSKAESDALFDGRFATRASLDYVKRWESILGINSPLNGTLEARRNAVRSKLSTRPPINNALLKQVIEIYLGVSVDLDFSTASYVVKVWYRGLSQLPDLAPLYKNIYTLIPANLTVVISYRYLTFDELDAQDLTFSGLDALNLTLEELERGEWI